MKLDLAGIEAYLQKAGRQEVCEQAAARGLLYGLLAAAVIAGAATWFYAAHAW